MQPNAPTPPPPNNDPFAFITQDTPVAKKPLINPSSMKTRILIIAGFVIFLIIAAVIAVSLLGGGDKDRTQSYIEIAQRQTEIIRISALASDKAKGLETKSLAYTTNLSVTSSQKDLTAILVKRGVTEKALAKELGGAKNAKTDELLAEAERNNRYDETFKEILNTELTNYQKQLNAVSGGAKKSEYAVFEKSFIQVSTLQNSKD